MEEHLAIVGLLDLAILAKHRDLIVGQFPERVDLLVRTDLACHVLVSFTPPYTPSAALPIVVSATSSMGGWPMAVRASRK
jgi:hypothetical protein